MPASLPARQQIKYSAQPQSHRSADDENGGSGNDANYEPGKNEQQSGNCHRRHRLADVVDLGDGSRGELRILTVDHTTASPRFMRLRMAFRRAGSSWRQRWRHSWSPARISLIDRRVRIR